MARNVKIKQELEGFSELIHTRPKSVENVEFGSTTSDTDWPHRTPLLVFDMIITHIDTICFRVKLTQYLSFKFML